MSNQDDAVPRAAPDDMTTRVGVEVIEGIVRDPQLGFVPSITVRLCRVWEAEDSNGIPSAIDVEVSAPRSNSVTNRAFSLTPFDKVAVLLELCEQADRDGDPTLLRSPMYLPRTQQVKVLVMRWQAFRKWFDALALANFAPVVARLQPFQLRAGALEFFRMLHRDVFPTTLPYDDISYRLLEV